MATYGTSNKYINYSVNSMELSYDINSNTSVVRVWIDVWRTNTGYTTYGKGTVYARINGGVYSAGITSSQTITSTAIRLGTWDVTVGHNADGSKTIGVSGWISHSMFSSSEQGYNHTLTTIPRQANMTDSPSSFKDTDNPWFKFSNPGNFNMECWLEPNPGGTHYAKRTLSGTSGTYTWTLTDEERKQLREACKGKTCTIRIGLFSNNCAWASYHDRTYVMTNAEPVIDSISTEITSPFGSLCLQGKSSLKIIADSVTCKYGATVKSYAITGESINYSGTNNYDYTGIINSSGSKTYTVTVTDSRGFTGTKTVSVDVTAYTYPTLSVEAYRSNSSGTKDNINGNCITVVPTFSYCNITGNNISTKKITIDSTVKNTSFATGGKYTIGTYALDSTHRVTVEIKDNVGNGTVYTLEIGIAKIPFQIPLHKNGMGIGRYCDSEGQFQLGYDLRLFGKILDSSGSELMMFGVTEDYDDD